MADSRINWLLVAKGAWLSANLTSLLMGFGSCMNDPYCQTARDGVLPFIYLLSFPGSTLFLVFNGVMLRLGFFFDVAPVAYYLFMGLAAITVGYLQWFRVIPALLDKQSITVLSLSELTPTSPREEN